MRIRNDLGGAEHGGQELHGDAAVHNPQKHGRNAENERQHLKYELGDTGMTLYRSELLIAKAKPSATEIETQRLLSRRSTERK